MNLEKFVVGVFMSSTKREIRHFHVVECRDGKEVYKNSVMHVQSQSCFTV